MLKQMYNPDVLTCISNLSSDEVFTPPSVVNQMLDTLPKELWRDEKVTFLDPVSKSGVFLREITKRLIDGLESKIPNLEERLEHILRNQVFGIGITELTSLISRRSLYCSKYANGKYSIVQFDDEQGNLKYFETEHTWEGNSCKYCGVSKEIYDRGEELESYSYSFIHSQNPEKLFNMKFDVIVGNPPYQMNNGGGSGSGANPIYHDFIRNAKKLSPRFLSMIIPSRWFTISGQPLKGFREEMLNDNRLVEIVDYPDANDCFPGINLNGGVCYFLWSRDNPKEKCSFTNITKGNKSKSERKLNDFEILIRYNECIDIIKKIQSFGEESMRNEISSQTPFGFLTNQYGRKEKLSNSIELHSSKGVGYVSINEIKRHSHWVSKYKVIIGKAISGHAGVLDTNGQAKIISSIKILKPNQICTQTYLVVGPYDTLEEAKKTEQYLKTKFVRFLMLPQMLSISVSKNTFQFVPKINLQEFWSDESLSRKYGLNENEMKFIDTLIKPM